MTTYVVTAANWNDPLFWQAINEPASGHALDFSGLGAAFSLDVIQSTGTITISDGTTTFTVGEAGVTGVDANFGGTTLLDFFTSISGVQGQDIMIGTASADVLDGNAGDDILIGEGGNDTIYGNGGADTLDGIGGDDQIYGGADNDEIYGWDGADELFGETGNDTLDGDAGEDFINGGAGADLIYGGADADHLEGGWEDDASDTIWAGTGNDLVFGYGGDDSVYGETGNDWIDGGAGNDFMDGAADNDRIVGDLGSDTILGGAGYDILTGGEGADSIDGGDDADQIWGNAGDTIFGGEGGDDNDTLYVSYVDSISYTTAESGTITFNSGDTLSFSGIEQVTELTPDGVVDGTAGADEMGQFYFDADGEWTDNGDAIGEGDGDSVRAGDGNDTIWAQDGNDTVHGEAGDDRISTGQGDNVAFGGAGSDTINTEFGNDTISGDDFTTTGPNLIVNGSFEDTTGMTVTAFGFSGAGTAPGWTDTNGFAIEFHDDVRGGLNATDGTNWADLEANPGQNNSITQTVAGVTDGQVYVLSFDAADLSNINDGTTLDNQLQVIWNGDVVGTIDASDGSWTSYEFHLIGGSGDGSNTLSFAGLGDASGIGASLDNVQMYAAAEAAGGADSINAWTGDDDIMAGAGNDTILAGGGADEVVAGSGDDSVTGDAGNDTIYGGDGADWIDSGADNDTVYGGDGDLLTADDPGGNDSMWLGAGDDFAYGEAGNDVIYGDDGTDTISGNEGADELFGGDGNDSLQGGQGSDTISGGNDNDEIIGDGQWYDVSLYASNGSVATNLTITNSADGPIQLWWIDFTGTPQFYETIQPGDTYVQPTFEGHNWVLRDDDGYWLELIEAGTNTTVDYGAEGLNDSIDGDAGNDTILGQYGNDTIDGGSGDDEIYGGSGNDSITGGSGNDTITEYEDIAAPSYAEITGTSGTLTGTNGNNNIDYTVTSTGADLQYPTTYGSITGYWVGNGGEAEIHTHSLSEEVAGGVIDITAINSGEIYTFYLDGFAVDLNTALANGDVSITSTGSTWSLNGSGQLVANDSLEIVTLTFEVPFSSIGVGYSGGVSGAVYTLDVDTNAYGVSGNDTIDGGDGNDVIDAGAGDDTISGGSGDDSLVGGDGDDSLTAGNNTGAGDTLEGGAGNDTLTDSFWNATLDGGDGADLFNAGYGAATIIGGEGGTDNDTVSFADADDAVNITLNADEAGFYNDDDGDSGIFTEIEAFELTSGADTLDAAGDTSGVEVFAGAGADSVAGGSGNDSIEGGAGNDTLQGGAGADTLIGGDGQNYVSGGTGDDSLVGNSSDDFTNMEGDAGADTLDGSAGIWDIASYFNSAGAVNVDLSDTLAETGGDAQGDVLIGIEQVDGSNLGDDTITADDSGMQIKGWGGDDSLTGGAGADILEGDAGNDTLDGGAGDDTIEGGDGSDTISGDAGDDYIEGGSGDDVLDGGANVDTLDGGAGNDTLMAGSGADVFIGGDGEDVFDIGNSLVSAFAFNVNLLDGTGSYGITFSDIEHVIGGAGDDTLIGDASNNVLIGATGNDELDGGIGNDTLRGGDGNDDLTGGAGDDLLEGGADADTIVIQDGFGTDTIIGGDTFTTGANYDTIDLSAVTNPVSVLFDGPGSGTITDSITGDTITFSGIEQLILTDGNDTVDATLDDGYTYVQTLDGDDSVLGSAGDDVYDDEIFGPNGQGNDTFIGADGNDEIWAGTDDDSVTGGLGSDSLFGQSGNDTIDGGADADTLQGGIGHDSVSGGDGADLIEEYVPGGTTVNDGDTVTGTTGADAFVFGGDPGTSATIILDDGSGTANDADTEYDIVFVTSTGNGASLAVEGFDYGTDRIQVSEEWSGLASNEIAPGHHEVTLTYDNGNSQTFDVFHDNGSVFDPAQAFFTYAGDDTLEGGAGNDTISGAFGADLITGGTGNDNIDVGAGDGVVDTVVMSDGDGADTITGFEGPVDNGDGTFTGQDQLDLSGMTDAGGALLNTRDVTVGNDGSGNAVLSFPNGDSITLVGIAPADVTDEDALAAMGIAAPDDVVEGTASGETIDAGYIGDPEGDRVDAGDNAAGNDDDSITAGAGNDTVVAGDGNDTVLGEGGADSIDGGIGDDNIDGGSENDTVFAWTGDDSVIGGTGDDVIFGQDGADTIRGGEGADSLDGDDATAGADQIFGDAGNDTIISDGGNDTIEGGADNDLIFAGADDDSVSGGTGNDQIFGEGGNDLIEADEGDDTVDGGDGNDTIFGFEGSDSVLGGAGDDEINTRTSPGTGLPDEGYGTLGDAGYYPSDPGSANDTDFVDGGLGNDIILTGDDNDTIFGGDGADRVDAGFDDDQIDGGAGADSIEGNEGNDTIVGGADGDIIYGDVSPDNPDYAVFVPYDLPNDGTDLAPSNNADSLVGGDGDDTIYGQDDNDTLVGDAGNDVLDGGLDDDSLDGADGNDTLIGGTGNDTLLGGNDTGADSLDGGAGDDDLSAGDGADTLVGGTGADSMFAGGGDDVFIIEDDFGNDTIDGWSTNETGGDSLDAGAVTQDLTLDLSQGSASDPESGTLSNGAHTASFSDIETITLGSGNDSVTGSTGGDTVNTGAGNDTVDAGDGADSIDAGTGDDSIFVDQGDTVSGGDGDDFFTLQDLDTSGTDNAAITITGGEGAETNGDTLQLTPDVAFSDITFSNTDDAAGGLSGSFTMADGTSVTFSEIENIICFTPGTKILTGHGERDIETLQIGDMVVTRDHGLRPIRWIGKRTVAGTGRFAPVWVGSAAMDGARTGFLVSPQHRMLFTGYRAELLFGDSEVLVPAKHLIDGRDVVRREQDEVTYIHIMFDRHEVIYAEGIATESFHAGDVGLSAICEAAREELFALFPELRTAPGHHCETARVCLKKHEAQLLVRDQDNGASFA